VREDLKRKKRGANKELFGSFPQEDRPTDGTLSVTTFSSHQKSGILHFWHCSAGSRLL